MRGLVPPPVYVVPWRPAGNSSIQIQLHGRPMSIVRWCFPRLEGETLCVQMSSVDSEVVYPMMFALSQPQKSNVQRVSLTNYLPNNPQKWSQVVTQPLPSMPLSQMARSSCMGTRLASCRTASHWSYWKTSARPGPCRCANGLRGLRGLSRGASNFSPNHTWKGEEETGGLNGRHV